MVVIVYRFVIVYSCDCIWLSLYMVVIVYGVVIVDMVVIVGISVKCSNMGWYLVSKNSQ